METRRDAPASISANARLAALRTGPAQDSPAASGPMTLSEAIAAGYYARRPWWQRFGQALAGRAPDTLRGRWTLEARAAVALACVALVGAVVGGWYFWQAQSTVVALPDALPAPSTPEAIPGPRHPLVRSVLPRRSRSVVRPSSWMSKAGSPTPASSASRPA